MIENEYGIKINPDPPGNPQENTIIERIHKLLVNLVSTYNLHETYVNDTDPWMEILATATFAVQSKYHRNKGNIPDQIIFVEDMILPLNCIVDCRYIRQR